MRWVILLILSLSMLSCGQHGPRCNGFMTVMGRIIKWDRLPIVITPNIDEEYNANVEAAMDVWNMSLNHTVFVKGSGGVEVVYDDGLNEHINAITYSKYMGATVYKASIRVNPRATVDEVSLMVHELGHVLGLDHDKDTVMQPTLSENIIRDVIEPKLLQEVRCGYNI